MKLYCGIDLHARNLYLVILNGLLKVIFQRRFSNDLDLIVAALEPYREAIAGIAVESTFNWYWLVDGLMDQGYRLHLANTNKCQQYEGLKYAGDRHDARWLARLLSLGTLAEGYIYPKEDRPLRDLCRRRSFLVQKRTSLLTSMGGAFTNWTGTQVGGSKITKWSDEDLEVLLPDPRVRLGISCMFDPVSVLTEQADNLEKEIVAAARLREEYQKLETIWGVGRVLALTIMYEVGEISRFPGVGDFASYSRLVNTDRRTDGKSKGKGNRKNGNPYLSWAFSEAAHFAEQHWPVAKRFAQRKRSSKNGIVANRALAHKLARAAFYVMRDKVDFDPDRLFR